MFRDAAGYTARMLLFSSQPKLICDEHSEIWPETEKTQKADRDYKLLHSHSSCVEKLEGFTRKGIPKDSIKKTIDHLKVTLAVHVDQPRQSALNQYTLGLYTEYTYSSPSLHASSV